MPYYDTTSVITLAGGGNVGLGGILSAGVDLFDYARTGKGFSSPLAAGLAAANLIGNVRGLSREGARAGGFNLLKSTIGGISGSTLAEWQTQFSQIGDNMAVQTSLPSKEQKISNKELLNFFQLFYKTQ